jgi:hypothetical protein
VTVNGDVQVPAYAVGPLELGRKRRAVPPPPDDAAEERPKDRRAAAVAEMNQEYAYILLGTGGAVLREGKDAYGDPEYKFLSMDAFKEWLRPQKVWTGSSYVSKSALWLNDEHRRQYAGLVFAPGGAGSEYYNLWRKFAVEPTTTGSCQRLVTHIADNVCRGDESLFAWVMGWFAAIFQRPTEKAGTALVLRGAQGSGKTIVGKIFGSLLGEHYTLVGDPRYVTGRFNAHLMNRLLLQLDEATWGGDHVATGKLKDLVTGDYQTIEFKGKEPVSVRNYLRLLITSNNDWVVPAGMDERRFAVLDIGDEQMQKSAYFQAIEDEISNGGAGRLLRYLLDYDLSEINLKQIPSTGALFEQKISSLSPEMSWWVDVLHEGTLPGDKHGEGSAPTQQLYRSYLEHAKERGVNRRGSDIQLGIFLHKYVPGLVKRRRSLGLGGTSRPWWYDFPSLATCRAAFALAARYATEWPGDAEDNWTADGGSG